MANKVNTYGVNLKLVDEATCIVYLCMDGVDEVYGFHNIPNFDEGDIRVCTGAFFAAVTTVSIKIIG